MRDRQSKDEKIYRAIGKPIEVSLAKKKSDTLTAESILTAE